MLEHGRRHRGERCHLVESGDEQLGVAAHPPLPRSAAGLGHPLGDRRRGLARWAAQQLADVGTGDHDPQVEAVEQRTREATRVAGPDPLAAPARPLRTALAARARVGGPHEQEAGRVADRGLGPAHAHHALLEGLTQCVEGHTTELAHLVEEQHPGVGQADLAGPHPRRAAADQRDERGTVVGSAERRLGDEAVGQRQAGGGVDAGGGHGVVALEGRQQARKAAGEHGLPRAGRPREQDVVAAGRRHLDGDPAHLLAADVGQVGAVARSGSGRLRERRPGRLALQALHQLGQRRRRPHLVAPDEGGLVGALAGHDDRAGGEGVDEGDHPWHAPHRPVEAQLAQEGHAFDCFGGQVARRDEEPDGDG